MVIEDKLTINVKEVICDVVEKGKWLSTREWDIIIRNEAIRSLFRRESIAKDDMLRLMWINMPNIILLMSNAHYHEVAERIIIYNTIPGNAERLLERENTKD